MLNISVEKIAHVIVKAREVDAKVASWDDAGDRNAFEDDMESILESHKSDATRTEVAEFIAGLNEDEQAELVAITWIGRGTYGPEELEEAIDTARSERSNRTEVYLLGIPLLSDYLEDGLEKLGFSVEDAEEGIL